MNMLFMMIGGNKVLKGLENKTVISFGLCH